MSYHHHNRLLAHWQPKKRPEGSSLSWGSRERYQSLNSSSVALAQTVCNHLNTGTGTYEISNKVLQRETGFSKGTITNALKELVEWGIFTRTRLSKERPYLYSLQVTCPPECEKLAEHNTPSELNTLPKKQATPKPKEQESTTPKEQARVSPNNRQLIESYKEINKEIDKDDSSLCLGCGGEKYLNGVIHQETCPVYDRLKTGKPWEITRERNAERWGGWDYAQKQRAIIESLKARNDKRDAEKQAQDRKFNTMVADQVGEQTILPMWREWLETLSTAFSLTRLARQDLNLALDYSRRGIDLEEQSDWRTYPHSSPRDYYSTQALAELEETF